MRSGKDIITTFLRKFDLHLMEGESVVEHLDPNHGMRSGIGSGFVLTDQRLLYVRREWWGGLKAQSARLDAVDYFEVQHLPRPKSTLFAAIFMFLIGGYLGGATFALTDFDISARYVQVAAGLLVVGSLIAGLWYKFSERTMISTEFGPQKVAVPIAAAVLEDAEAFRTLFFQLKNSRQIAV